MLRVHLLAMLLALLAAAPSAFAQEWAGTVKSVAGTAAVQREGKSQPLQLGDKVFPGDKLLSGKASRIAITLRDDTLISIGADTEIAVSEFSYTASTQEGSMLVSIVRGVVAMVSGLVAKSNPNAMRVRTPSATLGIRGTEFIVEVDGE